jgi:putative DNA modification/repair radical SAM protein
MEQLVAVVRSLREDHHFGGYIHLKAMPDASPLLLAEAGRFADRVSVNMELPTPADLHQLAPDKSHHTIQVAMHDLRAGIDEAVEARRAHPKAPAFAPAGQSTQMIVGATATTDASILQTSSALYTDHRLRRVYYSGFSPTPGRDRGLPAAPAPLVREHRLYQADWLIRFYGFAPEELTTAATPNLDLKIDPKTAWALRHPEQFPADINTAPRETLLRVPGLGQRTVERILRSRRFHRLSLKDLRTIGARLTLARPFIVCADWRPSGAVTRETVAPPPVQPLLWSA